MQFTDHRFTVSEVSALTETNLNTIQSWRRKGYFALGESEGWHRFTLPELFSVAVFAEATASTGNQEVASVASSMAVQMLTEIIENEAAPYFVGSARKGEAPVVELTYGARDVGRILADLIERGADAGAYVVVDYSAIYLRLFNRLHDGGYAEKKSGGAV